VRELRASFRSGSHEVLRTPRALLQVLAVPAVLCALVVPIWAGEGFHLAAGQIVTFGVVAVLFTAGAFALAARTIAQEAFLAAYAQDRGLSYQAKGALPATTWLLRSGIRRAARGLMTGSPGPAGQMTLCVFDVTHSTGRSTATTPYTVAFFEIAAARDLASGVALVPNNVVREGTEKISLESEALHERYDLAIAAPGDENRVRQLFSPVFIDWLAGLDAPAICFELCGSSLCVWRIGATATAAGLDAFRDLAEHIAARVVAEASEG